MFGFLIPSDGWGQDIELQIFDNILIPLHFFAIGIYLFSSNKAEWTALYALNPVENSSQTVFKLKNSCMGICQKRQDRKCDVWSLLQAVKRRMWHGKMLDKFLIISIFKLFKNEKKYNLVAVEGFITSI